MSGKNLIPNGTFEAGLDLWDATPAGVTLVQAPTKRFVLLSGESRSAAICSEPIQVYKGAPYVVQVERALKGDYDISIIGLDSLTKPDTAGEFVANEETVRIQVTAKAGRKVGIASVGVYEIGLRARLTDLRSTSLLREPKAPFEISCTLVNNGSVPITNAVVRFVSQRHVLAEDAKQEQPIQFLEVGSSLDVTWAIASQRGPLAKYAIEFDFGAEVLRAESETLNHRPLPSPSRTVDSIASGRRWFSVGSRSIRLTGHDTDLDFGPCLLTTANGVELGVLRSLAALVSPLGEEVPLYAKIKQVTNTSVVLGGKSDLGQWEIVISPEHSVRGIEIEVKLTAKKMLPSYSLSLVTFQTLLPIQERGSGVDIITAKGPPVELVWWSKIGKTIISESARTVTVSVARPSLLPGRIMRASALIAPVMRGMVSAK